MMMYDGNLAILIAWSVKSLALFHGFTWFFLRIGWLREVAA